ncbi:hypothetical protein N136_02290 [Leifsonia aquatica ATCC 14665]|uniref:Uncharacterized protein n=1 Tax=Leifsonia aquatica ATCC 14665 TaxID=1358026 RepID=U2T1K9_LEIAQ|nr:hypothetical protein N136_02290 [Leifsonia aquatica ATCC 14665]
MVRAPASPTPRLPAPNEHDRLHAPENSRASAWRSRRTRSMQIGRVQYLSVWN